MKLFFTTLFIFVVFLIATAISIPVPTEGILGNYDIIQYYEA